MNWKGQALRTTDTRDTITIGLKLLWLICAVTIIATLGWAIRRYPQTVTRVEPPYKVRLFYSPEGKFYVHHTVPMSEVPGMQVVIASNEQEGGAKYMFLAPATTTFTTGEEVQPVSISYSQHYLKHAGYQTVLKKK